MSKYYLKLKELNQKIEVINGRLNRGLGFENDKNDLKILKEDIITLTEKYNNLINNIPNV